MGEIIGFVIVGFVVGALARALMPGSDPVGLIGTLVIGIVGAIVGGYLWRAVFGNTEGIEWIGAIVTAAALLWVYRRLSYGRRTVV